MRFWHWLRRVFSPTVMFETRYLYNGQPATPEQEQEIKTAMAQARTEMADAMKQMKEAFRGRPR